MLLERADAPTAEDDYLVYNYNRFQACRFGLDGTLVHPKSNEPLSLREDILATLRRLEPHAAALESRAALEEIYRVAAGEGNHAGFLRRQHAEEGGIEGVVDAAVRCFREEVRT